MEREELEQLRDLTIKYKKTYNKPHPMVGHIEMLLIVNDKDDQTYKSINHFNLM